MQRLSPAELARYRDRLTTLDAQAHKPGNRLDYITEQDMNVLSPKSVIGSQVLDSYSDEELLDIFLKALDAPDHKLSYRNIYIVYRRYLDQRFGCEGSAKNKARTLAKQRKEEARWPPDWPERVSVMPLLAELRRRNKTANIEDLRLFTRLCDFAKQTGQPPILTDLEKKQIDRLLHSTKALELMGIPQLNKLALRHMRQYWREGRKRPPNTYDILAG